MKKMTLLFSLIFILSCTSQKSACEDDTKKENIKTSIRYLDIVILAPSSYNELFPIALATCLQAFQNEKKCNQKSEYLPSF